MEYFRLYEVDYQITQGQGPVLGSETFAVPKHWIKTQVKSAFLKDCVERKDGSYRILRVTKLDNTIGILE